MVAAAARVGVMQVAAAVVAMVAVTSLPKAGQIHLTTIDS